MTVLKNASFKIQAGSTNNIASLQPEPGAIIYNEADGFTYLASDFGWVKQVIDSPIQILFYFDGVTQFTFWWRLPSINTLTVNWGDETTTDYVGADSTVVTGLSAYTEVGYYFITLEGDYPELTSFNASSFPETKGSINGILKLQNLSYLAFMDIGFIGDLKYLANAPSNNEIYLIDLPFLTGDASVLGNTAENIQIENCPNTYFGGVVPFAARDNKSINFSNNGWSSQGVDNAIKSLTAITNTTIKVALNKERTANSNAALKILLDGGNWVGVTESKPILTLGAELFTIASAISDSAGNEEDGITGWTPTNLGVPNIFESQSQITRRGTFAFKLSSNPDPLNFAGIALTTPITVLVGDYVRGAFSVRHIGVGGRWRVWTVASTRTTWLFDHIKQFHDVATYYKMTATTYAMAVTEQDPLSNDGGVYFDDLSIRKATF